MPTDAAVSASAISDPAFTDAAFTELWARHEELTTRFAQLLHDDAGQVLTSIALQLSIIEHNEIPSLQSILDDLLERFRQAQAELGAAVVARRGLLAALSQLSRARKDLTVQSETEPDWPLVATQATFRIIEALAPKQVLVEKDSVSCEGCSPASAYAKTLALSGGLTLQPGPRPNTIRIYHANPGPNR